MTFDITASLGDILAIVSLVGVGVAIGRWQTILSRKIGVLSGKVTGVWAMSVGLMDALAKKGVIDAQEVGKLHVDYEQTIEDFESKIHNPITPEKAQRRRELTAKLNNNTIDLRESKELKAILDEEMKEAQNAGDWVVVLAIVALIGLVIAIIAALSSSK